MKTGTNYIYTYVEDASGVSLSGVEADISPLVVLNDTELSTTVAETSASGLYQIAFTANNSGKGYFFIDATDASYTLEPFNGAIEIQNSDTDTVMGRLTAATITPNTSYSSTTYSTIEGDDIEFIITLGNDYADISGYSNLEIEFRDQDNYTEIPDISGCSVNVYNATERQIQIEIPLASTDGIITALGVRQNTYYGDVQGDNPSGKHKTLATVQLNLRRQYTD